MGVERWSPVGGVGSAGALGAGVPPHPAALHPWPRVVRQVCVLCCEINVMSVH